MQLAQHERRSFARDARPGQARICFLDGPAAGQTVELSTRDQSYNGASFLLSSEPLLGGNCRIELSYPDGIFASFLARIIRCRSTESGFHVAVQFRRQMAA